ncbi:acyloxyacyl hydrolase [Catalinimonas alkaloidigena]|uniref:acyloxyacyl hydrolase n=1 Tax=Catalinimonas alkaloidigena TaxID=1075417 RepID=UPI0015A1A7F8|nr:acyloxyacyl hydrolase [Catalinimonas alkaloidigena]
MCWSLSGVLLAQSGAEKACFAYDAQAYYGAIFRYQRHTQQVLFTHPYSLEVTVNRLPTGRHDWERMYGGPTVGVTLSYTHFGTAHELGRAVGATTQFRVPLRRFRHGWLEADPGLGVVYGNRPYDRETNPYQKAYSTHFSVLLRGNLNYYHTLADRWALVASLAFRHFSNGAMRNPNNGMNYPLVGVGVRYQPHGALVPIRPEPPTTPVEKTWHLHLAGAIAWKQVTFGTPRKAVYQGNLMLMHRLGRYASLTLGTDLIHDPTFDRDYAARLQEIKNTDPWKAGVTVGGEMHIGTLGVLAQMGLMAYDPHLFNGRLYQRFGLRYQLTRRWFVQTTVRAYSRKAECLEWGGGIRF